MEHEVRTKNFSELDDNLQFESIDLTSTDININNLDSVDDIEIDIDDMDLLEQDLNLKSTETVEDSDDSGKLKKLEQIINRTDTFMSQYKGTRAGAIKSYIKKNVKPAFESILDKSFKYADSKNAAMYTDIKTVDIYNDKNIDSNVSTKTLELMHLLVNAEQYYIDYVQNIKQLEVDKWSDSKFNLESYIDYLISDILKLKYINILNLPNKDVFLNGFTSIVTDTISNIKYIFNNTTYSGTAKIRKVISDAANSATETTRKVNISMMEVKDNGIVIDMSTLSQKVKCPYCKKEHKHNMLQFKTFQKFKENSRGGFVCQIPLICEDCSTIIYLNENVMDALNGEVAYMFNNSDRFNFSEQQILMPINTLKANSEFELTDSTNTSIQNLSTELEITNTKVLEDTYKLVADDALGVLLSHSYDLLSDEQRLNFLKANIHKVSAFKDIHKTIFGVIDRLLIVRYIDAFSELKNSYIVMNFIYNSLYALLERYKSGDKDVSITSEITQICISYTLEGITLTNVDASLSTVSKLIRESNDRIKALENTITDCVNSLVNDTVTYFTTVNKTGFSNKGMNNNVEGSESDFRKSRLFSELVNRGIDIDNFIKDAETSFLIGVFLKIELDRTQTSLRTVKKNFDIFTSESALPKIQITEELNSRLTPESATSVSKDFIMKTGFSINDFKEVFGAQNAGAFTNQLKRALQNRKRPFDIFYHAQDLRRILNTVVSTNNAFKDYVLSSIDRFFAKNDNLTIPEEFVEKVTIKQYNTYVLLLKAGFQRDELDICNLPISTTDFHIKKRVQGQSLEEYVKTFNEPGNTISFYAHSYVSEEYANMMIALFKYVQWSDICTLNITNNRGTQQAHPRYVTDAILKSFIDVKGKSKILEQFSNMYNIKFEFMPVIIGDVTETKLDKLLKNMSIMDKIRSELAEVLSHSEQVVEYNGNRMDYTTLFNLYDFSKVQSPAFLEYLYLDEAADMTSLDKSLEALDSVSKTKLEYYLTMFNEDTKKRSNVYNRYNSIADFSFVSYRSEFVEFCNSILDKLKIGKDVAKKYLMEVTGVEI
jgi:hypothetical protein